jgi:hypothetical protein
VKKNILSGKISQENHQNNGHIIMTNIIYQLVIFHNYAKILEGILHDSEGENNYRGSQLTCVDALVLEPPRTMMNWGVGGVQNFGTCGMQIFILVVGPVCQVWQLATLRLMQLGQRRLVH